MAFALAFEFLVSFESELEFDLETERMFDFEFETELGFDFGFDVECRRQTLGNFFLDLQNTSEGRILMPRRPPRGEFGCPGDLSLLRK